ncbi:hypothetical protein C1141_20310, partial [Vibrio agarivorans]
IKDVLSDMRKDTLELQENSAFLEEKLTDFINLLSTQRASLQTIEESNKEILADDGSALQEKIKRLIVEKDQLNEEYIRWVKISATTPTYAWVWPWGTIAAISTAAAGTNEALQLKAKLDAKKAELEEANKELDHTHAVYQSWKLATSNIDNISEKMTDALRSLEKLRGGWELISIQLDDVIPIIDGIDSENCLDKSNAWIAAMKTAREVEALQDAWRDIGGLAEKWVANAWITEETAFKIK